MKKMFYVAAVAALFAAASCSKSTTGSYTCVCKQNGTQISSTTLTNVTRDQANTACTSAGSTSVGITCSLQ